MSTKTQYCRLFREEDGTFEPIINPNIWGPVEHDGSPVIFDDSFSPMHKQSWSTRRKLKRILAATETPTAKAYDGPEREFLASYTEKRGLLITHWTAELFPIFE